MYCPSCGSKLTGEGEVCPRCGVRVAPVSDPATSPPKSSVQLSPPWDTRQSQRLTSGSDRVLLAFLEWRTKLHENYIDEQEKTKRLWLALAVAAALAALLIVTFAPEGRETLSYWIGGALLIFATGAAGYKRVWGKSNVFSVGADQDKGDG